MFRLYAQTIHTLLLFSMIIFVTEIFACKIYRRILPLCILHRFTYTDNICRIIQCDSFLRTNINCEKKN